MFESLCISSEDGLKVLRVCGEVEHILLPNCPKIFKTMWAINMDRSILNRNILDVLWEAISTHQVLSLYQPGSRNKELSSIYFSVYLFLRLQLLEETVLKTNR